MLRRLARAVPLALLIATSGCNCGEKKSDDDTAADDDPFIADTEVEASIRALGGDGTLVVVLRPDRLPAVQAALLPIVRDIDPEAGRLLAGADTPEKALAAFAPVLGLPENTVQLEGWDPSRPVVASLFESPYQGPPGTILPQVPITQGHVADMRHAILLPAKDDAALVESLAFMAATLHLDPIPELVEGIDGGRAFREGSTSIAFLPEGKYARIVIFGGGIASPEQREANRERLAAPKDRDIEWTPATSLLAADDTAAALLFRPWRGRAAWTWFGCVEALRAIQTVSRDQRAAARMKGSQIVLSAELLLEDLGADFDDQAIQLAVVDGTPRLRAAMSLAPDGREVVESIEDGLRPPFGVKADGAWAELYVGGDIRGALKAASPPAWLEGVSPFDIFDRIRMGGSIAMYNLAMRHPFGIGRYAFDATAPRSPVSLDKLPLAIHAVLLGVEGEVPKGALAMELPEGASALPFTGMLALAKTNPDLAGLRVETKSRDGHPVVLVGLGVDPSEVFELDEADERGIAYLRVDPGAITRGMPGLVPEGLAKVPPWQLQWQRRGRALVAELVPEIGDGKKKLGKVPVARLVRWDSPVGSERSDGLACLSRAGNGLANAMGATVTVSDDQIATVFVRGMQEVKDDLACAEKDEATKTAARALRMLLVEGAAEMLTSRRRAGDAQLVLKTTCADGYERACEAAERLAALPHPRPPKNTIDSGCPDEYTLPQPDHVLVLDAKAMTLDDEAVEVAKLRGALQAKLDEAAARDAELGLAAYGEGPPQRVLGLYADADTKMSQLRPALRTAHALGFDAVVIGVEHDGRERPIKLELQDAPKGSEWLVWTVDGVEVTTRGAGLSSTVKRTSPTPESLDIDTRIYTDVNIDITDDTTWQQASAALAAGCNSGTLLTERFSP